MEPKGQSIFQRNRDRQGMTAHFCCFRAVSKVGFGLTQTHAHTKYEIAANARRTLLWREVGPSPNSQLEITHGETERSKSEEMK